MFIAIFILTVSAKYIKQCNDGYMPINTSNDTITCVNGTEKCKDKHFNNELEFCECYKNTEIYVNDDFCIEGEMICNAAFNNSYFDD